MTPPTLIQQNLNNSKSLTSSPSTASLKSRLSPHLEDDTLVAMFRRICSDESKRDKIVLKHNDRQWTLAQLDEITGKGNVNLNFDRLSQLFVTQFSCKKGDCIAIYMHKCAEYVFAYIAALKAGAAYLPLDITYPDSLLKSVLDEVKPAVVCITSTNSLNTFPENTPLLLLDEDGKWLLSFEEERQEKIEEINCDDLAYIVYSSGTTGKPKGIKCPHRGAVISYKWRFLNYPYSDDDIEACNVFFVWEMFRPILQATTLVIIPDSVIYDPHSLCNFLAKNQITRMLFTPSLLEMVLDTQDEETLTRAFQCIRIVILCGEVVTCALLERFIRHFPHVRCINLYSISECHDVAVADLNEFYNNKNERRQFAPVGKVIEGVKILILDEKTMKRVPIALLERFIRHFPHVRCINLYSISECHDVAVADLNEFYNNKNERRQFAPVGKVIEGVKILILDEKTMKRVPIGVPGEIYVAGPTLAIGYINRPEINAERFVPLPEEYQKEMGSQRMYRTGDWGYLLPNLVLEICGRCDTTVRIRGYSVELQAIEAALLNLNHVRSCTVISIGNEGEDKQLAAYIVLRDKQITRKQLRAQLKRVLPFYMMPQYFIFMEKLPLLAASSKIDKKALPSVDFARDVVEIDALPQTENEKELAKIWIEILHLGSSGHLDIQESFFDMGGYVFL
uniref:Uncharacterized protein n=1 Tax=Meloidogyne javanica TaxID=6303 RepID=A0A915LE02_MELJA